MSFPLIALLVLVESAAPSPAPPALTKDEVARLLLNHACSVNPHEAINRPGFLAGLAVHLWSLDEEAGAIAYLGAHRIPSFAPMLLADLEKRDVNARFQVAHVIGLLPDLPPPDVVLRAGLLLDPGVRPYFYRAVQRTPDKAVGLSALRDARAKETNPRALLTLDLVAAKLGGEQEAKALKKSLAGLTIDDVNNVIDDVYALAPAPHLAPLLRPWLSDKRPLGTMSHRQTRPYLVRDHAVWLVHILGVPLNPPLTHIEFADAALIARTRRALDGAVAR